jgi:3-phosphoshikimate 1-carboxyvinyltransferase
MKVVRGTVVLPGSKSISNRTLLLAGLAAGETIIRDVLESDDTQRMIEALRALGVRVENIGPRTLKVIGAAGVFPVKQAALFLGNAGTAFRPLTAVLALCGGDYKLSGVPRMHERPIGDLVDALRQLGARMDYLGNSRYPPLHILPAALNDAAEVSVKGNVSSQFLTGLLLALPLLRRRITVRVVGELISRPYVEITLNTLKRFGVTVERDGWSAFTIPAHARYASPGEIYVEGDASAASYFIAAGAISGLTGGGPVRVMGVGRDSIQGDVRFAGFIERMGARVTLGDNAIEAAASDAAMARGKLAAIDADCNDIPDAAMTLAAAALFADGATTLRNIGSWRVKETDRIAAMATELRKLGATVEEGADYLRITPHALRLTPHAAIDTYDDHRMAMCFSLAVVGAQGVPVRINDPQCVNKTFPGYFQELAALAAPVIAIDGPSASGKGTVAQAVAKALGYHYLDSGALYRILGLACLRARVDMADETLVESKLLFLNIMFDENRILLDGEDVADAIREESVSAAASQVSVHPRVRAALLKRQRDFQQAPGLVADGRDMGSVVFPQAALKIFLTASAEARAERRYKQLMQKGLAANILALLRDIQQRDQRDSERAAAPLRKYPDAVEVDTTHLSITESVERVLKHYHA